MHNATPNKILPWYNYQLIDYINQINLYDKNVFEFGCGYSTIFYALKGANVYGVETKSSWFEQISLLAQEYNVTNNIRIILCNDTNTSQISISEFATAIKLSSTFPSLHQYCKKSNEDTDVLSLKNDIANTKTELKFDLIIIDSRDRIECLKQSINFLKEDGCIVLDNSERSNLQNADNIMQDLGFGYPLVFSDNGPSRDGISQAKVWRVR